MESKGTMSTTTRYQTYDGEGIDQGQWSLADAREAFVAAEYDPETQTITVGERMVSK